MKTPTTAKFAKYDPDQAFLLPIRLIPLMDDSHSDKAARWVMNTAPGIPYQFRAELHVDIIELLKIIPPFLIAALSWTNREGTGEPECAITLRVLTIDDLRDYMREVADGHVMAETVATPQEYTGIRPGME